MKTIRQIAAERGVTSQAIYKQLGKLGIEPKIHRLTGWGMLTAAQERRLANGRPKKGGSKSK